MKKVYICAPFRGDEAECSKSAKRYTEYALRCGTLRYRVCDTKVIESYEIDKIKIQEDRDLLTLLTCYYASNNHKMRFACYCERIYENE